MPDLPAHLLGIVYGLGPVFKGTKELPEPNWRISSGRFRTPYRTTWSKWDLYLTRIGLVWRNRDVQTGLYEIIWVPSRPKAPSRRREYQRPPWVRRVDEG